jgi:hypothetical protein
MLKYAAVHCSHLTCAEAPPPHVVAQLQNSNSQADAFAQAVAQGPGVATTVSRAFAQAFQQVCAVLSHQEHWSGHSREYVFLPNALVWTDRDPAACCRALDVVVCVQ